MDRHKGSSWWLFCSGSLRALKSYILIPIIISSSIVYPFSLRSWEKRVPNPWWIMLCTFMFVFSCSWDSFILTYSSSSFPLSSPLIVGRRTRRLVEIRQSLGEGPSRVYSARQLLWQSWRYFGGQEVGWNSGLNENQFVYQNIQLSPAWILNAYRTRLLLLEPTPIIVPAFWSDWHIFFSTPISFFKTLHYFLLLNY